MIILINGAFGVGKTTIAQHLVSVLPNAMLYDPELVGLMLRVVTENNREGIEDTDDFQDIALWRKLTVITAGLLQRQYKRTLVVPMTLANPAYFREIKDGLIQIDPEFYHFCLIASPQTIYERLKGRGDQAGSWPWQRVVRCVEAFKSPEFAEPIDTEGRSPETIVDLIISRLRG